MITPENFDGPGQQPRLTNQDAQYHVNVEDARAEAKRIRAGRDFNAPAWQTVEEDLLDDSDDDFKWLIKDLHYEGFNTSLTAGFKVGKTTLVYNLVRSLADGEPFLGKHEVTPLTGRIAYFNFELTKANFRHDISLMNIKNRGILDVIHLRGENFDLRSDQTADWAIRALKIREIQVWILDPWSGVFCGEENSNSEIADFVKRLDWIKAESGVADLFLPIHTGRTEESSHARGGAKTDDWADARWNIWKKKDEEARYFAALGRGEVDQQEEEIAYDRITKKLYYTGNGSRVQASSKKAGQDMLTFITANPGCTTRDILRECGNDRLALKKLIANCEVGTLPGSRNSILHYEISAQPSSSLST